MYPGFAKTAREEGFDEIADWFETLARAERATPASSPRASRRCDLASLRCRDLASHASRGAYCAPAVERSDVSPFATGGNDDDHI